MSGAVDNYYSRGGEWCNRFNDGAENTCRLILLAASSAQVGVKIYELQDKTHHGLKNVYAAYEAGMSIISALRCFITLEKIVTGKLFWKIEKKDDVINGVEVKAGQFIKAPFEDGQYRMHVRGASAGQYVRDFEDGELVARDVIDVAQDIILAVGRFFSTVFHFHKLGLYDLGKHTKWIGHTIMAAFAAVVTIGLIKSFKDCVEAPAGKVRQAVVEVISNFLDIASFPNEAGLVGGNVILDIVMAGISAASAGVYLLKEWVYYNS